MAITGGRCCCFLCVLFGVILLYFKFVCFSLSGSSCDVVHNADFFFLSVYGVVVFLKIRLFARFYGRINEIVEARVNR
jgi:hypothetical protein